MKCFSDSDGEVKEGNAEVIELDSEDGEEESEEESDWEWKYEESEESD